MEHILTSSSVEETRRFGQRLGELLKAGDVICLFGDLGVGKTSFAQGIGEALNVKESLTSPTFMLIQEYTGVAQGREIRLVHMDLYRLQHRDEAEVIGVEDNFLNDTICLIEWPEVALELMPEKRLEVEIKGSGLEERRLIFRSTAREWEDRLRGLFL